jgi:hypothetical protein
MDEPFFRVCYFNDAVSVDGRMINDCRAVGGMSIARGNRNARRKPAPVSFCQRQIPHDLT